MHNLHYIQMLIIKHLLFHPGSKFSEIKVKGITSDHLTYHINTLIKQGLVYKKATRYSLTAAGKKYAGSMDTDLNVIEKQPKVSVLIIAQKEFKNQIKYLWQKRTKEPYFGYWGFPTGKIKYGETIAEASLRELYEETGLTAAIRHLFTLHELVYDTSEELLEDKYFNIVLCSNLEGKLVIEMDAGVNKWLTEAQLLAITPQYHNEREIFQLFKDGQAQFLERKYVIEKF